ncbi:MAG: MFS transporter [Thermoleophilia bacterium]
MSLLRGPDGRPGPLPVVGVSLASLAAGTFSIVGFGALAPELEDDLGLSRAEVGLITSLVFLGAAVTSRKGGALTDRAGPAPVLGISLACFAACIAVAALAPGQAVLYAAVLVGGLAYGGINPPTNVVVAGSLARRLGFFLSVKQSGVPLGGLLAGVVLPPVALALGWRAAIGVAAGAVALVAATTPLLRNAAILRDARPGEQGPPMSRRELVVLGVFGFVMSGTQWTLMTYLTLFLTEEHGFALGAAGLALGLAQGLGAGGRLLWGWLSDRPGRRLTVLMLLCASSIACLSLLAADAGGGLLWAVLVVAGITTIGWNGAYHALVADRAGPGRIGRATGDTLVFIFSGTVALPPLLGLAVDAGGSWTPMWAIGAGAVLVVTLLLRAELRRAR